MTRSAAAREPSAAGRGGCRGSRRPAVESARRAGAGDARRSLSVPGRAGKAAARDRAVQAAATAALSTGRGGRDGGGAAPGRRRGRPAPREGAPPWLGEGALRAGKRAFRASGSLAGALGCAERRRRDLRVPGLLALASREQQAPGICGLRTGPRSAAAGRLLGLPGWICSNFFLLSGHWPEEGLKHLCSMRWRGESPGRGQMPELACDGRRDKTGCGYSLGTLPTTHRFAYTDFCTVTAYSPYQMSE
nr:uncharacterized protein LOC111769967 [Equus caballus]